MSITVNIMGVITITTIAIRLRYTRIYTMSPQKSYSTTHSYSLDIAVTANSTPKSNINAVVPTSWHGDKSVEYLDRCDKRVCQGSFLDIMTCTLINETTPYTTQAQAVSYESILLLKLTK